jgi:phospholipase C
MRKRAGACVAVIAIAFVMLVAPVHTRAMSGGPEQRSTATPIKHFVTLMQENHSFDNYFGTYPGADGIPAGTCMPVDPAALSPQCVKPFHIGHQAVEDLGHSARVFEDQYNGGQMNGFVSAFGGTGIADANLAMGYYDQRDIPYYWNIADNYVLFDRFFTSAHAGSLSNHMHWVAAAPGNPQGEAIPSEGFDIPTIFDRLEAAGVSWKFYVQNYDPTINLRNQGSGDRASQAVWAPLLNFPRFLDNPRLFSKIVPMEEYFTDLARGTLPAVSYLVPSGTSEHPPGSIQAGERFVRTLITSLMRSSAWKSSAFMWTYDDWGGWYDHVAPPAVDQFGYGFRAPALLVSAYARTGFIDSTQLDFTSMLAFIEHNWGLEPLTERDKQADPFLGAFDFGRPPRAPTLLSGQRAAPSPSGSRQMLVYLAYGGAAAVTASLLFVSVGRRRNGWLGRVVRRVRVPGQQPEAEA